MVEAFFKRLCRVVYLEVIIWWQCTPVDTPLSILSTVHVLTSALGNSIAFTLLPTGIKATELMDRQKRCSAPGPLGDFCEQEFQWKL